MNSSDLAFRTQQFGIFGQADLEGIGMSSGSAAWSKGSPKWQKSRVKCLVFRTFLQGLDIHVPSFVRISGLSFCHTLAPTNVWHWAPAEVTKPPYKSSLDELASVEVCDGVNKDPAIFNYVSICGKLMKIGRSQKIGRFLSPQKDPKFECSLPFECWSAVSIMQMSSPSWSLSVSGDDSC